MRTEHEPIKCTYPIFSSSFIVWETMAVAFSISTEKHHEETSAFLNRIKDDFGKLIFFFNKIHSLSFHFNTVGV